MLGKIDYEVVLNSIAGPLNNQFAGNSFKPITWFISFGSLLKFVRNKGDLSGEDLDVSILYEEYEPKKLEEGFARGNLAIEDVTINDVTRKPFHYSLKSTRNGFKYCVFAWIKHKGIRWHTYDYRQEGTKVPSKYTFKGIPAQLFDTEALKVNYPGTYRNINIPLGYGALLDYWYPDWKTPRKGVSECQYMIEMKSCKAFSNNKYDIIPSKWWKDKYKWGKSLSSQQ